jgi:hypothetical protein
MGFVEKQNAETGLMSVVAAADAYGYEAEDRHLVRAFLGLETPRLTFDDGVDVVELLMAAYQSAEQERTLAFRRRRAGRIRDGGGAGGLAGNRVSRLANELGFVQMLRQAQTLSKLLG